MNIGLTFAANGRWIGSANLAAWSEACVNANRGRNAEEVGVMLRRSLLIAGSVIAGSAFAVGTVHADPPEHYSGTDSFSFDDCGFQIDGVATFSGTFQLKAGRHGDPTPYLFDNYRFETVYTNPATGAFFTVSGNGLYHDVHIVNVSGTVYSFEANDSGQQVVVRDMNGQVVVRDRGHLRVRFSVDTLGDDDLSNDIFFDDFEFVAVNGPHPTFGLDFCEVASDLIG
jgi:hypothetical protein